MPQLAPPQAPARAGQAPPQTPIVASHPGGQPVPASPTWQTAGGGGSGREEAGSADGGRVAGVAAEAGLDEAPADTSDFMRELSSLGAPEPPKPTGQQVTRRVVPLKETKKKRRFWG